MTDRVRVAVADRMNRLDEVEWDRCSFGESEGTAFGWIAREDGRADFVVLDFSWGETTGFDGETVPWFAVGTNTSSAVWSALIAERILGPENSHRDCERVEDVLGDLVVRKVELA